MLNDFSLVHIAIETCSYLHPWSGNAVRELLLRQSTIRSLLCPARSQPRSVILSASIAPLGLPPDHRRYPAIISPTTPHGLVVKL